MYLSISPYPRWPAIPCRPSTRHGADAAPTPAPAAIGFADDTALRFDNTHEPPMSGLITPIAVWLVVLIIALPIIVYLIMH